jgi:hypothetical protein
VATDIIGIHDYEDQPELLAERYHSEDVIGRLFTRERPGGRMLTIEGHPHAGQPIILSEFGGIAFSDNAETTWGYTRSSDAQEFQRQYTELLSTVRSLQLLAGFCYTQFADTFQEANGLLYADRTPKFPLQAIRQATRGQLTPRQQQIEREWQARMLHFQQEQHIEQDHLAVDSIPDTDREK